jgi:hypothetical protein
MARYCQTCAVDDLSDKLRELARAAPFPERSFNTLQL